MRALVACCLALALVVLPGCLRSEDSCIRVFVERGLSADGEATFTVTDVREGPWGVAVVDYSVYPLAEGGPLERGHFDRPGPRLAFEDADPKGALTKGDVLRWTGNASEIGGIEIFERHNGRVVGGTIRCR